MEYDHHAGNYPVYGVIIPIVCAFGLIGNVLSFLVLTRKRFQTDNLMYAYMAGLAIIDIAYLICTSIRCHYNLAKDGLNCETDYNLMNVDVNILPGFSTIFGTSSDLVIASMTVNRYHLIKSLNERRVVHVKKWIGYVEVLTGLMFCSMCSLPYFFQHDISMFKKNVTEEGYTYETDCYDFYPSTASKNVVWPFFTTLLRIIPTFGISLLNIHMYRKLKKILKGRQLLRERRKLKQRVPEISYGNLVEDVIVASSNNSHVSEAIKFRSMSNAGDVTNFKRRISMQPKTRSRIKIKKIRIRPKSIMIKMFQPSKVHPRHSKELRSTRILLCVVISHFVLATPGNIIFFVCAVSNINIQDGNGSLFPSFNIAMMKERPWLAGYTYFAHTLFVLKYAINYILYFVSNHVVREETAKLLFQCKNLYWYKDTDQNFAT